MTIKSYYWDGTTLGDATEAPYDADTFLIQFSKILLSDVSDGFVVPNYNNNLEVTEAAVPDATVVINTGAAYAKGIIVDSDTQESVTITANASGNPRIDRIVLRISWATQAVTAVAIAGTPAATPALPAVTQTYGTTWDIPLANVWVANGFATITDLDIHDERLFLLTSEAAQLQDTAGNLIPNSEFMVISNQGNDNLGDKWNQTFTASLTATTKPDQMSRGRALRVTALASPGDTDCDIAVVPSTMYAFKFIYNVTAGDEGHIEITTDSAAPNTVTKRLRRTGAWIVGYIYYETEADASVMTVTIGAYNNTDVVDFGQPLLVSGYHPGPFRQIHEEIYIQTAMGSWTSGTGRSSGTTNFDFSVDVGQQISPDVHAVLKAFWVRDSGSAGAGDNTCFLRIGPDLIQHLAGVPNDTRRAMMGWVPTPAGGISYTVDATGAGTMDVWAWYKGFLT